MKKFLLIAAFSLNILMSIGQHCEYKNISSTSLFLNAPDTSVYRNQYKYGSDTSFQTYFDTTIIINIEVIDNIERYVTWQNGSNKNFFWIEDSLLKKGVIRSGNQSILSQQTIGAFHTTSDTVDDGFSRIIFDGYTNYSFDSDCILYNVKQYSFYSSKPHLLIKKVLTHDNIGIIKSIDYEIEEPVNIRELVPSNINIITNFKQPLLKNSQIQVLYSKDKWIVLSSSRIDLQIFNLKGQLISNIRVNSGITEISYDDFYEKNLIGKTSYEKIKLFKPH